MNIIRVFPPPPGDWVQQAACGGAPVDIWFPDDPHQATEAKTACAACPVRNECLDYALDNRIQHGIWGGLTHEERRKLSRGRPRRCTRCGTRTIPARDVYCDPCRTAARDDTVRRYGRRKTSA